MPRESIDITLNPRCRAKFSPRQKRILIDMGMYDHAVETVQSLHKIDNNPYRASNFNSLEVAHGKITFNDGVYDREIKIGNFNSSINYTVCGAFIKGHLTDTPHRPLESKSLLAATPETTGKISNTPTHFPSNTPTHFPEKYSHSAQGLAEVLKEKDHELLEVLKEMESLEEETGVSFEAEEEEPYNEVTLKPEPKPLDKYEYLTKRFHELRDYCRSENNSTMDEISTGALLNGFKMLEAGFETTAILHALTINWPETARSANDITDYDPLSYGKSDNGYHRLLPYVEDLALTGIPVMLIGPTQSGKSTLAKHLATKLDLPFEACPLTGGASPGWLLGRDSRDGFKWSDFARTYRDGGVFLFDEVDAADPNMFIVLNDAISGDTFSHPYVGKIKKHENFIAIAGANTFGTGATAQYRGRARMDGAVLERFRLGRVYVDYDKELEFKIMRKYMENNVS